MSDISKKKRNTWRDSGSFLIHLASTHIKMRIANFLKKVKEVLDKPIKSANKEDAFSHLKRSMTNKPRIIEDNHSYEDVHCILTPGIEKMIKKEERDFRVCCFDVPYKIEIICGKKSILLEGVFDFEMGGHPYTDISPVVARVEDQMDFRGLILLREFMHPSKGYKSEFLERKNYMEILEFMQSVSPEYDILENHMREFSFASARDFYSFTPNQLSLMKHVSKMWIDYSYDLEEDGAYAVIFARGDLIVWFVANGVYTQANKKMTEAESALFNRFALAARLSK